MAGGDRPLAGRGVVLTRPREQASGTQHALESAGARVALFPVLEIAPEPESEALRAGAARAARADWLIFASPNAVRFGLPWIRAAGGPGPQTRFAAVGEATAVRLEREGITPVIRPRHGATSEDLLTEPEFVQAPGEHVMIVRGVGGRGYLAETLRQRGASVEFLEVYRRRKPKAGPSAFHAAVLHDGPMDAAVVTSAEGLENFLDLIGPKGRGWLAGAALVVVSHRIAALAAPWANRVEVAETPAADHLVAALMRALATRQQEQNR